MFGKMFNWKKRENRGKNGEEKPQGNLMKVNLVEKERNFEINTTV